MGGEPAQLHVLSNRCTGRRSCGSRCHHDMDNEKAMLSLLAVALGLGDGLWTQPPLHPVPIRARCSPASPITSTAACMPGYVW